MKSRDGGDPGFERLVERELSRGADRPAGACPPVELLAAWFDRALPSTPSEDGADGASIEAHLAVCQRCQALMAGLARSEPEILYVHPKPAPRPWSWHLRWAAPLAAAALVVVAVTSSLVLERDAPKEYAMAAPAAAPPPLVASSEPAPQRPTTPPRADAEKESTQGPGLRARERGSAKVVEGRAAVSEPTLTEEASQLAQKPGGVTPPEQQPPKLKGERAADARGEGQVLDFQPRPRADDVRVPAAPMPTEASAPAAEMSNTSTRRGAALQGQFLEGVAGSAVPGRRQVAWRYVRPGEVARTADAGTTWQAQALPPHVRLSALSAVSDTTCWAVGPSGTVMRTLDGRTWEAVAAPADADFVGVTASSETRASVRTSLGDTYETADGGATWRKR